MTKDKSVILWDLVSLSVYYWTDFSHSNCVVSFVPKSGRIDKDAWEDR